VALAFAGLSSGTVALLSSLSRAAAAIVLLGLLAGVLYLGWRVAPLPASRRATPLRFEPTA
jgi:hypothetical protein